MDPPSRPSPPAPSGRELIRDRSVITFLLTATASTSATTLQAAALAKHVYDITDSELALGMLGLVEFLPALVLLPLTGSAADRFDRRRVAAIAIAFEVLTSVLFCLYAADPDLVYEQAVAAGAKALGPAADQPSGVRMAFVEDPLGTQWYITRPAPR